MTLKATLTLMAATLAPLPLYAQAADAPAAVAQAPGAAAVRAQSLGPLALIPADAEAAVIITHISSRVPAYAADKCMVDNAVFAVSKGTGESLGHFLDMIHRGAAEEIQHNILRSLFSDIREELIPTIVASLPTDTDREACRTAAANIKLHPVYLHFSAAPGKEDQFMQELDDALTSLIEETADDPDTTCTVEPGKVHVAIKGSKTAQALHCHGWQGEILERELSGRTFNLTIIPGEASVLAIVYEGTEAPYVAATPEQSILATETWAAVDSNLADDIIFAAHFSPELGNGALELFRGFLPTIAPAATIFDNLGKAAASPEEAQAFAAAAKGSEIILKEIAAAIPTLEKPSFIQFWQNADGYHLELSGDACGAVYETSQLKHTGKASDTGTILYAEGTRMVFPDEVRTPDAVLEAALMSVFEGYRTACTEEAKAGIERGMQEMAPVLPVLQKAGDSLSCIMEGLDSGTTAVIVDNKATMPSWMNNGRRETIIPRLAIYSGVADRAKLGQGWDGLLEAAADVLEMAGEDPSALDMLPIVPSRAGDAISYTVSLPIFTPDMCPNVTVSDKAFAIGSSSNLNKELVASTGSQEFAGTVFTLRLKPMAVMLKNWADTTRDRDLRKAAGMMQDAARAFETVSGSSTIKDGVHTLRIDLNFNK